MSKNSGALPRPEAQAGSIEFSPMVWTTPARHLAQGRAVPKWLSLEQPFEGAPSMGKSIIDLSPVTTVGLDLAKHVFQVHCVDASGRLVVAKAIRRNKLLEFFASLPPCLVGLEASGSAHHWARELMALGHDARMMPPAGTIRLTIKAWPRSYTAAMPTARDRLYQRHRFLRRSSAMRFGSISGFP